MSTETIQKVAESYCSRATGPWPCGDCLQAVRAVLWHAEKVGSLVSQKPSRMVNGISARMAVEAAIIEAVTLVLESSDIDISLFWTTLYDQGFEVVGQSTKKDK